MTPTFTTIVQIYQFEGLVALGKMLNPVTNESNKNIDHARFVIDVLGILQQKTHGNLSSEETSFLDQTLSTLRLNFLEEFGNPSAPSTTDQLA